MVIHDDCMTSARGYPLVNQHEPRKKTQCIVYVRELYYITFAKEKCWVAKDRESNLLRERSRKRSLRYFKLFVLFIGNGPVGMDGKLAQEVQWKPWVSAVGVGCRSSGCKVRWRLPIDQVRQFSAEKVIPYLRQKKLTISLFFPYLN